MMLDLVLCTYFLLRAGPLRRRTWAEGAPGAMPRGRRELWRAQREGEVVKHQLFQVDESEEAEHRLEEASEQEKKMWEALAEEY
eukprot:596834-Rhodomonas_salina.3